MPPTPSSLRLDPHGVQHVRNCLERESLGSEFEHTLKCDLFPLMDDELPVGHFHPVGQASASSDSGVNLTDRNLEVLEVLQDGCFGRKTLGRNLTC